MKNKNILTIETSLDRILLAIIRNEEVLVKISNHAIAFRSDILKDLIKNSESYNDGIKKYVLHSLDKKKISECYKKTFRGFKY